MALDVPKDIIMSKKQPATGSSARRTGQLARATMTAVDPRPLAAYQFGYLCCVVGIEGDAYSKRLQQLTSVIWILGEETTPKIYTHLREVVTSLHKLAPGVREPEHDSSGADKRTCTPFAQWFLNSIEELVSLAREQPIESLKTLADGALPEGTQCRVWYDLGSVLGEYVRNAAHQKGRAPSLRLLKERIRRLPDDARDRYPILRQLLDVEFSGRKVSNLRTAIERNVHLEPGVRASSGTSRLFEAIFGLIKKQLEDAPPVLARVAGAETTATASQGKLFVPVTIQADILDALQGRAMKKSDLAEEVCGGDGTRLYRKHGIKELITLGLVKHQHGVGYYRPDRPPPDAINLS